MVGQTASSGRIGKATHIKWNKAELYPKAKIPRTYKKGNNYENKTSLSI